MSVSAQEMLKQLEEGQSPAERKLAELSGGADLNTEQDGGLYGEPPELWDANDPVPSMAEFGGSNLGELVKEGGEFVEDAMGLLDVANVIGSGAAGQVVGGTFAAINRAINPLTQPFGRDFTSDDAVEQLRFFEDAIGMNPHTERGKMLLEDVAVPLMALEEGADEIAWRWAGGNAAGDEAGIPSVAAAIKTTLLGAIEMALPGPKALSGLAKGRRFAKQMKELEATANALGIKLSMDEYGASVLDLARRMTPDERARHMPYLQEQLRHAAKLAEARKNAAYSAAKRTNLWIETRSVRAFADDMEARLFEADFDLTAPEYANVRATIDDLRGNTDLGPGGNFSPEQLAVRFSQLERVRRRTGKRYGRDAESNRALTLIKKGIDEFIDNEFNNAAINAGSSLSGDMSAVNVWKNARELNADWHRRFNSDRVIKDLIGKDATPETMSQWIMGASAMGAKKEAATVVGRLKEILGENHPSLEGVRQDFLFSVAKPLFKDVPNYKQFVANYKTMVRENPSIVRELGLKESDLRQLHDFAVLQTKLPPMKQLGIEDVTKGLSQFFVGHKIARAALRVNVFKGLFNKMIGTARVGRRQMLYELAGLKLNEPMIHRRAPQWAQIMSDSAMLEFSAGAAATTIPDTMPELQEDQ